MQNRESTFNRLIIMFKKQNRQILLLLLLFMSGIILSGIINYFGPDTDTQIEAITQRDVIPLEENYLDSANYKPIEDGESENTPELIHKEVTIKRGQGMMDVLVKSGADRKDAYLAIKALSEHYDMKKLQIGQKLQASYDADRQLVGLEMQKDFDHMIKVRHKDNGYQSSLKDLPSIKITRHVEGTIDDSLFLSAHREGLPQRIIVNLIRIFSFDVDFQREIRKGDKFELFYERKISEDGKRVEEGNILYARLILRGKPISLYRYKAGKASYADYFHENGKSAKKALMKTPIEGARLSSYYGRRKHPVLGYTRMHKGLDFGAPTGTPIMAAGDGVVERASRYGSYGNYVRIRHKNGYKTAYAHMSKYGRNIKKGRKVKQGQIIGYVGATGRVTARHLHYEVLVNGKQVNPLRLKIPTGIALKGSEKKEFLMLAQGVDQQITHLKQNILLTRNQEVAGTIQKDEGHREAVLLVTSPAS